MSDQGFQSLIPRAKDSHVLVRRGVEQKGSLDSEASHMEKEAMKALAEQLTDCSEVVRLQAAEAQ